MNKSISTEDKLLLSIEEASALLGLSRDTVYSMAKTNKEGMPSVRVGGRVLIPRKHLETWINRKVIERA